MKLFGIVIASVLTFASSAAMAQSDKEDVAMIQAAFGKDKKILVSYYMEIAPKDSVAFWKLYDDYEDKRKAISRERLEGIKKYADEYTSLDNTKATALAEASFNNDLKLDKLHQTYFRLFSKIIGGRDAAKLFQLEAYLHAYVRFTTLDNIPFIDELDKSKIKQ